MRCALEGSNQRLFTAALLVCAVLAGCGKEQPTQTESKAPAAPPPVAVAPKPAPPPPPPAAAPKATPAPAPAVAPPPPVAPPPAVRPPPPPPQVASTQPPPKSGRKSDEWVFLGQQTAGSKTERDRVVVGRDKGGFKELRFTVDGAAVEIHEIVITFANGEDFRPKVKWVFNEQTRSRAIDLPGERRYVNHVDFVYRSANPNQRQGLVSLYGR